MEGRINTFQASVQEKFYIKEEERVSLKYLEIQKDLEVCNFEEVTVPETPYKVKQQLTILTTMIPSLPPGLPC